MGFTRRALKQTEEMIEILTFGSAFTDWLPFHREVGPVMLVRKGAQRHCDQKLQEYRCDTPRNDRKSSECYLLRLWGFSRYRHKKYAPPKHGKTQENTGKHGKTQQTQTT
jgi:hypothetical protein